jgi:hypothetical protein
MLPNEWLEYVEAQKKMLKRPPATPKRRMPRITRNTSPAMRRVNSQTPNAIRAMYVPESKWNVTPLLDENATTTREVGPNDQYNPASGFRSGKATGEPIQSNKTTRRGARANGGGKNSKKDWSAIAALYLKEAE